MKSILRRAGVLTCLILLGGSWSYKEASAEVLWPSKCATVNPNQNPTFQQINCLLTNAALEANIPPEVVKAVASKESGWKQFDANGKPVIAADGGIGIMQITNQPTYDQQKLKNDIIYNIQAGVDILKSKYQRTDLPKTQVAGPEIIENWYFPVMAYNGTKPVNSPLKQADGTKNTEAYQEKVFALLQNDSFLDGTKLAQYPFSTADFQYDPNSDASIVFKKLVYKLSDQMHASTALFHTGDKVVVTKNLDKDPVNLRSEPTINSSNLKTSLALNTTLIITGDFVYDKNVYSSNQFVWYPVKTEDQKFAGYISSAYLTKKVEAPVVSPVDDNDVSVSGKAPANVQIQVMNGTSKIATTVADAYGSFKAGIPVQKAGAKLTVSYVDKLNARSFPTTISVTDKTAPPAPAVNTVNNKSADLSGKTEANATVTVTIAGKAYSTKANLYGTYKVAIPIQNTGTSISVTAKDSAGNVSAARSTTVIRVAPNMPTVSTVRYYSTSVTGSTEKDATVIVTIGTKTYTTKANLYGTYKVNITKQAVGTKLSVYAKDAKGQTSATRTTTVSK